jgi:hypothetical protein
MGRRNIKCAQELEQEMDEKNAAWSGLDDRTGTGALDAAGWVTLMH